MNGILIVNKPSGISSNATVAIVKKALNQKTVGHLGTLDPLASGVLPVTIGKATRLFDFYLKKDKEYLAQFVFGKESDTLDISGKITKESKIIPSKEQIQKILVKFIGKIQQIPPVYSAKNVNGQRAYALARKNIEVKLSPKEVEIFDIKLTRQVNESTFEFAIRCGSGTYIRSLARDIAGELNTYALMSALIRRRSGEFELENSYSLEKIKDNNYKIISIDEALKNLPCQTLNTLNAKNLIDGKKVKTNLTGEFVVKDELGVIGLARNLDGFIKITSFLKELK